MAGAAVRWRTFVSAWGSYTRFAMNNRLRLRLLAIVPALFAMPGAALITVCVAYRAYVSPTRGVITGVVIVGISAAAIVQLWRGSRSAPMLIVASGGCLLISVYTWPWVLGPIDLVNAVGTDEEPSFIFLHAFQIALATILFLTIGGSVGARRTLRAKRPTDPATISQNARRI